MPLPLNIKVLDEGHGIQQGAYIYKRPGVEHCFLTQGGTIAAIPNLTQLSLKEAKRDCLPRQKKKMYVQKNIHVRVFSRFSFKPIMFLL